MKSNVSLSEDQFVPVKVEIVLESRIELEIFKKLVGSSVEAPEVVRRHHYLSDEDASCLRGMMGDIYTKVLSLKNHL